MRRLCRPLADKPARRPQATASAALEYGGVGSVICLPWVGLCSAEENVYAV